MGRAEPPSVRCMPHRRHPLKPLPPDGHIGTWLNSLPQPDVREGGESSWELWREASRQMDEAFADTQPSDVAPLSVGTGTTDEKPASRQRSALTADTLMTMARRNNRACPQPPLWTELYHAL